MLDQLFAEIGVLYDLTVKTRIALNKALHDIDNALMTVDECRELIYEAQEEVNKVTEAISAPMETMETMEIMDQDLPDSMRDRMEQIVGQIEALRDVTEDASIALNKVGMQDKLNEALDIEQVIENELSAVMDLEESDENNASNASNVSNASFGGRRTKKQRKHKKRTEKRTEKRKNKKRTEKRREKRRGKRTLRVRARK